MAKEQSTPLGEALPCPMCGKQPRVCDLAGWEVICDCGVDYCSHTDPSKEAALAGWNKRTTVSETALKSWVAFSLAAGETPDGIMHRALVNIVSISPLSTAAPQEIATNALLAADALRSAQAETRCVNGIPGCDCASDPLADAGKPIRAAYHEGYEDAIKDFKEDSAPSATREKPCATCNGDPAVCATVPGLRHCEAATRESSGWVSMDNNVPLAQWGLCWAPSWRHPYPGMRNGDNGACWVDTCEPEANGWQTYATHWMPFPEAPHV